MEEIKHAKGPFRTDEAPKGYMQLVYSEEGNGFLFAECSPKNVGDEQAAANAQFIVNACNFHYQFLEASRRYLQSLEAHLPGMRATIDKLRESIEVIEAV